MKHARHLLLMVATLLCSIAVSAEGITDVSQLSNTKLYFVSQPYRGSTSWTIAKGGTVLQCNGELGITADKNDARQQFAFISNDGGTTYYLYHPAEKMYVNMDGSLNATPHDPVFFMDGAYDNTFIVYFDINHFINVNENPMLIINQWGPADNGWRGTADGGNSCSIEPVGEFEPTEALAMFGEVKEEYTIEFAAGANGWVNGAEWHDQSQQIVGYTSPLYRFQGKVETLRITVNRAANNTKYFCLSELEFYDADGQKIALTADAIISNADHNALNPNAPDGGGIPALLDGDTGSYFHSAWQNMPAGDHYLEVTLPNGGYDAFSFRMLSRAKSINPNNNTVVSQQHTFPGQMVMTTTVAPVVAELPEGVVNDLAAIDPTKCYTIVTKGRGAWAVDAAGNWLSCNGAEGWDIDATDTRQQFAILSANAGDYYLYSVSAKKFVTREGNLVHGTADAIAFTDAASVEEGRVMVSFRDYANAYINIDDRFQDLVISWWGYVGDGNAVLISEAGDFDAAEALAMLASEKNALTAQAQELVAANVNNHAAVPSLGQYSTFAYRALVAAAGAEDATEESLEAAIAAFEASKCLPVFTIDGVYGYVEGMSIYENEQGELLWKATDPADESMRWTFDIADTAVCLSGLADRVVAKNLATDRPFWGYSFLMVTETSENIADDGIFLLYTEGVGDAIHAQQNGQRIVYWNATSASSASAWKFTFVGTTYSLGHLSELLPVTELADAAPTKCYTVTTNGRGAWAVDAEGTVFSSTSSEGLDMDAADARQQFAILSANGEDYYLYSVDAKKFVQKDGSLVPFVGDAIALADASSIEEGRVQVRFKDFEDAYINLGGEGDMLIDDWSTIDDGNAVLIADAGDFDATEALAILADPEGAKLTFLAAQAQELLTANAGNHAAEPALGQYATDAYENLAAAVNSDSVSVAALEYFIAAFEDSKCLPVFTIDGVYDYVDGMSIYDAQAEYLYWKETDRTDETMLWAFDMTETVVGVTEKVVVKNLATGNLFMDKYKSSYIQIAETNDNIVDDGLFQIILESSPGYAIFASPAGMVIPAQGNWPSNSACAWKFTYVGTTYKINEVPDTTVTEPYNWAGVYTVRAEGLEVLHDAFTASDSFEMEIVYNLEDSVYQVTKMLGYDVTNFAGCIPFTPSTENPNEAEISGAASLQLINEEEGKAEYFCLRNVNLERTPLTITRLEDGTFTISDFCISHQVYDCDTEDFTEETLAAYYRGVTAEVEYTQMPIEFRAGTDGNIEGWLWHDYDNRVVGYTSPLYRFEDKVEDFRIMVNKNGWGYKYFCLSELEFYDGNGNKIELTEANVSSNADHNTLNPNQLDGDGIPALFDGDTQTYFHSAWQNMPTGDHYLQITLPNGGYDAFSFRMLSRAYSVENGNMISHAGKLPAEMVIDVADTSFRSALQELLDRAKGYNAYSSPELGYYVEDFSYLLDAIAKAEALLSTEPTEAECEAMLAELTQAVEQFMASDKTVRLPEPGKAYRIVSALPAFYEQQSVEKAITINASDNKLWWGNLCADSLQQEFVFEPVLGDSGVHLSWIMELSVSDGTTVSETQYFYNLKHVATGLYVSYNDSAKFHLADEPCTVYLTGLGIGQFGIRFRVENEYGGGRIHAVHAGDHNNGVPSDSIGDYGGTFGMSSGIVSWYAGLNSASAWYIRESSTQTDTIPSLKLVGVTPDSETSEEWVRALTLSFNKEVDVWSLDFDVRGMNTGEEFYIYSHHIGENSDGGFDLTLYLGDTNNGWTKMITVPDTYTYTIPAGAIKSVDGEDLPETTVTFTVTGTFPIVSYSPAETTRLEQIELTFDKVIEDTNIYYYWYIYNEEGDAVASINWGSGHGSKNITLGLDAAITTPGEYYLQIFAGAFEAENFMPSMPAKLKFTVVDDTPVMPADYVMKAQDAKGRASSVVNLPIEMDNATAVKAFQFDLYLPDGVSVVSTTEDGEVLYDITFNGERAKSSHLIAAEPQEDGALRIVAYSTKNASFVGNSGVLVNVAIAVGELADGDYEIEMRNIRMVTATEEEKLGANNISTLVIENTLLGDVNGDGHFTMLDVVMMVNAVLEKPQANFDAAAADLSGDGKITMVDVVRVLRLVLTDGAAAKAPARASRVAVTMPELGAGECAAMGNGRVVLPVALNNNEAYSAFQLDVVLPAGVELAEATLTGRAKASHTIAWNTLADGSVRVVAYAMDNAAFRGDEGALLNLVLNTSDAQNDDAVLTLTDALFATVGGAEHRADDLSVMMRAETTGVGEAYAASFHAYGVEDAVEVVSATDTVVSIYAATGQLVQQLVVKAGKTTIALPAGVYVINGNKVIVK